MAPKHKYALFSETFKSFIEKSIPACSQRCIYSRECFHPFYLLETGEVKPFEKSPVTDYWCVWPKCPRKYLGKRYLYGYQNLSILDLLSWHLEIGAHRKEKQTAGVMDLLRIAHVLKDKPQQLHEHIWAMKRDSK
mgnify:CR=1 FL=1